MLTSCSIQTSLEFPAAIVEGQRFRTHELENLTLPPPPHHRSEWNMNASGYVTDLRDYDVIDRRRSRMQTVHKLRSRPSRDVNCRCYFFIIFFFLKGCC